MGMGGSKDTLKILDENINTKKVKGKSKEKEEIEIKSKIMMEQQNMNKNTTDYPSNSQVKNRLSMMDQMGETTTSSPGNAIKMTTSGVKGGMRYDMPNENTTKMPNYLTNTTTMDPIENITTTPAPCGDFCTNSANTMPWTVKCKWKMCQGCDEC